MLNRDCKKWLYLLSGLLCLLLSSCATNQNEVVTTIPQWVETPQQDDGQYIYGIGEGRTLDAAKQSGLKDIASKFSIMVKSETNQSMSERNGQSDLLFQQKVNTQVKDIELTKYELLKTEQHQHQYYVLLAMSRSLFIKDKQDELAKISKSIEIALENINKQNKLEQLYRYNNVLLLAEQARPLLQLISVVDRQFDANPYLENFRSYQAAEKHLLKTTQFFIHSSPELTTIAQGINDALQKQGFQVGGKSKADGVIEIKGLVKESEVFSTKTVKIDLSVLVKSQSGELYKKKDYTVSGSSVSSYESANNSAVKNLIKKVEAKSDIYEMLGFN